MKNDYSSFNEFLLAGRNKDSRTIANNTRVVRLDPHTIAIVLHATSVVKYYSDGRVALNTGGWQTVTTKERINEFSPFAVYQRKGKWFVDAGDLSLDFSDGITFNRVNGFVKRVA